MIVKTPGETVIDNSRFVKQFATETKMKGIQTKLPPK